MASRHLPVRAVRAATLLALGSLGACGMPQASDPAPPQLEAEAPPVLLGAPEAPAPAPAIVQAEPARRPGWGTMAPIPNPTKYAAGNPPYRLIGPTAPESPALAENRSPPRQAVRRRPIGTRIVQAEAPPTAGRAKPRVRHWIMPARNPG